MKDSIHWIGRNWRPADDGGEGKDRNPIDTFDEPHPQPIGGLVSTALLTSNRKHWPPKLDVKCPIKSNSSNQNFRFFWNKNVLRIRGIGFDEGKCCFINLINICIFFLFEKFEEKNFPASPVSGWIYEFPGILIFHGRQYVNNSHGDGNNKKFNFYKYFFFFQQLKGGKQTIFRKMEKSEVGFGSERRFRRFYVKTFRNSENPRTHKDVFHLGLSL